MSETRTNPMKRFLLWLSGAPAEPSQATTPNNDTANQTAPPPPAETQAPVAEAAEPVAAASSDSATADSSQPVAPSEPATTAAPAVAAAAAAAVVSVADKNTPGAGMLEATAVVAPLTPVAKSVAKPETANSAGGATVASKSVPGSKSQEDSAARLPAKASVNKTRVRSVSSAATRNARRLSSRKQALTQADRPESELPAREKSVHKPNVGNPWESPTSTGFNQK